MAMTPPNHPAVAAPSPWIARFRHLTPPGGRVLDVAAGGGRHSRLFLEHGHGVTAVDRDTAALSALADGTDADLEVISADLESGAPWPFRRGEFAAVVVCNYLYRPHLPALTDTVAAGGVLIYDTFAAGNERFGRPRNPDFLLRPDELLDAVGDRLTVVAYEHGIVGSGDDRRVRQRICAVAAVVPVALADGS